VKNIGGIEFNGFYLLFAMLDLRLALLAQGEHFFDNVQAPRLKFRTEWLVID